MSRTRERYKRHPDTNRYYISAKEFDRRTSTNTEYGNALKDMFAGRKPKIRY